MNYFKSITTKLRARGLVAVSIMSLCLGSVGVYAGSESGKKCDGSPHHRGAMKHDGGAREWSRGEHPHYARLLDLTDVQRQTLKDFRASQEPAQQALHEKIQTARDALVKAGESNASDDTLNKLALNVATLHAQKEVSRIKARQQLVSVLTPEQKEKLTQWEAERDDFKQRKRADKHIDGSVEKK
ncbi:MAG: hypothetical protein EOO68_12545 [Moraxellaceae bacterium]|nr:MAG: hypothetical protein EOO68_12545 [Moraxellaceae bacterium]